MPINPSALGAPAPDEQPPSEAAAAALSGATNEQEGGEPAKRRRRTKAELIADADVPTNNATVEVKDSGTGAKVQRPWLEAVDLVKSEKAEFVDKTLKYALLKYEQQQVESAFAQPQPQSGQEPLLMDVQAPSPIPESAALGDEVVVGTETYRLGHGGVLTSSPVADSEGNIVKPKRRWQRELGTGLNGPWESKVLTQTEDARPIFDAKPVDGVLVDRDETNNGKRPDVSVESERLPYQVERVSEFEWKIGTGILEKIGMPQIEQFASASQMQVGPITASRYVLDDGRRTVVDLGGREAEVPTTVIEAFEVLDNTVEFIARRFRGQLQSFLEATGAIRQSTS